MNRSQIAEGALRAFPSRDAEGEPIPGNHDTRLQLQAVVKLVFANLRRGR